jgi:hypothetical protein
MNDLRWYTAAAPYVFMAWFLVRWRETHRYPFVNWGLETLCDPPGTLSGTYTYPLFTEMSCIVSECNRLTKWTSRNYLLTLDWAFSYGSLIVRPGYLQIPLSWPCLAPVMPLQSPRLWAKCTDCMDTVLAKVKLNSYSEEIPPVWNLKIHYLIHKNSPLHPITSQINSVYVSPIYIILILMFSYCLCEGLLSTLFRMSDQNFVSTYGSRAFYMLRYFHTPLFYFLNNTWLDTFEINFRDHDNVLNALASREVRWIIFKEYPYGLLIPFYVTRLQIVVRVYVMCAA